MTVWAFTQNGQGIEEGYNPLFGDAAVYIHSQTWWHGVGWEWGETISEMNDEWRWGFFIISGGKSGRDFIRLAWRWNQFPKAWEKPLGMIWFEDWIFLKHENQTSGWLRESKKVVFINIFFSAEFSIYIFLFAQFFLNIFLF